MTSSSLLVGSVRRGSLVVHLLAAVVLAVATHRPPPARGLDAPPTEFSAARADEHLRWVAAEPRPVGSARLRQVREELLARLTALGVTPEVQQTQVVRADGPGQATAATVSNVLARLPGTDSSRAILVAGHYDSVPTGPGAADNGAAVAAMLETLRALRAGPPLAQDVLFLFTDAEEVGLLGAEAFREHPLFKNVTVALNFEARGSGGPSILFETSTPDGWLVQRFLETAPHPIGNSLASAIYHYLPNDTDLTVFRRAGRAVMNFAFIDGFLDYHTRRDSLETLDRGSLQHHGENMLALVRVLANEPLPPADKDTAAIFFNPVGSVMFRYPQTWALPFALLLAVAEVLVLSAAVRARRVRLGNVALAAGLMLGTGVVAVALTSGVWLALRALTGLEAFPHHHAHQATLFLAGLGLLTLALFGLSWRIGASRLQEEERVLGARWPWLLLTLASAGLLPGGSYLFAWLLLLTAPLAWTWAKASRDTWGGWLLRVACGGGALLIATSTFYPLATALGLTLVGVAVLPAVLLFGLLQPAFSWLAQARWRPFAAGSGLAGAVLLLLGSVHVGASTEHPWPDGLAFWQDEDQHKAYWLADARVDGEWPLKLLGDAPGSRRFQEALPWVDEELLHHEVPPLALEAPRVRRDSERQDGEVRELTLHLEPPPGAALLQVKLAAPVQVLGATVWGRPVPAEALVPGAEGFSLDLWQVPPEGVPLTLRLRGTNPGSLRIGAVSLELPTLPDGLKRPPQLMPAPYGYGFTDTTVVTKTETL
ncbi:M20/M25/M40 family metallo-hydrolase [Hyalangium rubrum]|uniref:M20/M25/M40 family metallo-hydrolase n=1 Tax=Hyalangium rubrum TaxID=3103134 RepID=A0ABU5GVQ7_9BACT|nr:M20/M25/M40 family metallo-hydrolase [Hyalangium sp. s54d21]MDY7225121.1 M20/M25/M40 family metallo-hydrolase [Hyalangium sp. s54d21]